MINKSIVYKLSLFPVLVMFCFFYIFYKHRGLYFIKLKTDICHKNSLFLHIEWKDDRKKNLSLNNKEQNPNQILILLETFASDVIQSFLFGLLILIFLKNQYMEEI